MLVKWRRLSTVYWLEICRIKRSVVYLFAERVGMPTLSYLLKRVICMNKVEAYIDHHYDNELAERGFELADISYEKNGKEWFLRLFIDCIDREKQVDINDCEQVSRYLSEAFDEDADFPIDTNYRLEVSSPGIERLLRKPAHFQRFVGEQIRLRLYEPLEGQKNFIAQLLAADEKGIHIQREDGLSLELPYHTIAKANIYFQF